MAKKKKKEMWEIKGKEYSSYICRETTGYLRRGGDLWVRTELLAISGTVRSADLGECVYLTEGLNSQEGPKLG